MIPDFYLSLHQHVRQNEIWPAGYFYGRLHVCAIFISEAPARPHEIFSLLFSDFMLNLQV